MNDRQRFDFLIALGQEFCTALDPVVEIEICHQDGYEVFSKVLGKDFGLDALRTLSDSQVGELRSFASKGCGLLGALI